MAATFLIIDGYNLLHASGLASRRYAAGQMERARKALVNLLARHLNDETRQRTMVVFDAQNAPGGASGSTRQRGVEVVFAPPGGDADTLIEELVRQHSAPRQLLVISGDRRLQRAVRRRRGHWLDSESFHRWLLEPEETRSAEPGRSKGSRSRPARSERKKPVSQPPPDEPHTAEAPPDDAPAPRVEASGGELDIDVDQVEFWQERIDELFEEQSQRKRNRRRRKP